MSESCCSVPKAPSAVATCPVSGYRGKPVEWLTVAALASGPVPPRQKTWLCRDPGCDVVYFGEKGMLLRSNDLRVTPGFKSGGDERLVCYCFEHRRRDLKNELQKNGRTTIPDRIGAEVKAGNCACEVRNPSGKCCLGEVKKAEQEIRLQLQSNITSNQEALPAE